MDTRSEQTTLALMPVYTVAKNVYDVPCTHPMCDTVHKDLVPGHEWTRTEWVVLKDGEREGTYDVFDRKRDALAALRRDGLA